MRQSRELLVRVDRSRRTTLGRQLEEQLRDAIRAGILATGRDLPSTRALAEDLAVSRGVVVRAYAQLAAEGYLELRQGANPSVRGFSRIEPLPRRALVANAEPKVQYDFDVHLPELGAFPRQAWLRSVRHAVTVATNADLGYGDPRGLRQLRVEISDYLGRARGVVAVPEHILITTGSTHALSLIGRALSRGGVKRLGFENPSHQLLHSVAKRAGLRPVGVPIDLCGLRVDALAGGNLDTVFVTPAHQFPTGVALSTDRRSELVLWARSSGGLIIEDDYDAEFRYDRSPIGAIQGLCPEVVAYIGSTGKTFAPGIRLGWAVLPSGLIERVGEELRDSMLHVSGIDQLALADFVCRGEFDRHLRRMRTIYKRRRDALVAALAKHLPDLSITGIAAGLHVVVELPSAEAEAAAVAEAKARGILVKSLFQHALPGYEGPAGLLIGYGNISEPAIPIAVEQLAKAVRVAAACQSGKPRALRGPNHPKSANTAPVLR
jgi:GntR family transcriptional regulator / MocR family aminotransferase